MNVESKVFLRKKFFEYYSRHMVPAPPEVQKREFGFGTLTEKIKVRHKSFRTEKDLHAFLRREAPFYISYSTAYYDFPANPMNEKVWRGADLVFDLDAGMDFLDSSVLSKVKKEALSLIGFLEADFGIDPKDMRVNFSGSKGYHIHVLNEGLRFLGREERREIVDYITGKINFKDYLRSAVAKDEIELGPKKGDPGWYGRIYDGLYDLISRSSGKELMEIPGIGEKKAKRIMEKRERILKELEEGRYDRIPEIVAIVKQSMDRSKLSVQADPNFKVGRQFIANVESPLIQNIIEHRSIHMEAEDTDKMVTIDTSRLIRLPDTIHGGSGLVAKTVSDLEEFDPLTDALAFGKDVMKVAVRRKVPVFDLGGERFGPFDEGVLEVPEYVGMYLLFRLRDDADVIL